MPRTEEQFEKIRITRRNHIMDAALHIFSEKGFAAASINMIAKRAGVSKGLIYNYFESKEDLIKTILINGFDEFFAVFDTNEDGILSEEEFKFFINQTFDILKSNIPFWRIYFAIMLQADVLKLIENELMELLMPIFTTFESYYRKKGVENPMAYARLVGAMLDGISLNYIMEPESFPLEEVKNIFISKFI